VSWVVSALGGCVRLWWPEEKTERSAQVCVAVGVVAALREARFVAVGVVYCKYMYLSVSVTRMRSGTF
jgi:hypothetical protein